jgi:Kef-type K+ transport system membrane component KefB
MNELTSIGLILLLALMAGHLVKVLRVPEVTGYILVGVALGPSLLGWLTQDDLAALGVLSEVALGLILFSVGSVFEFSLFRRIGRQVLIVTIIESAVAAAFVTGGALAMGQSWPVALLLGTIATATAPASTLMVIREHTFLETEGAHHWRVWRRYLRDLAPLLFK